MCTNIQQTTVINYTNIKSYDTKWLNIKTDTTDRPNNNILNVCCAELCHFIWLWLRPFPESLFPTTLAVPSKQMVLLFTLQQTSFIRKRVSKVFDYNKWARLTKWVYQFNVMLWLLWFESEDHMQMIMKETHKHRAWTRSTKHTNKPQTHNTQCLSQCMCSLQSAHKHAHAHTPIKIQVRYKTYHAR